jgi:hypothetical protein
VAKNAYQYPPDEFDQVDLTARPKEVHAARRGPWSRVWPFLLVIVLIPAITFGLVYFFGDRLPSSTKESSPPPASTPTPSEATTAAEPQTQTPAEPETPEPAVPVLDMATKVTVYNDGQPSGSAKTASETLTAAGYTAAGFAYPPNPASPSVTTVYYSTEDQAVTASDVSSKLGASATELNEQVAGGAIVVILK